MECSGRTQRSFPAPQRMAFGHGKVLHDLRHDFGNDLGTVAAGLFDHRDIEAALLVFACLRLIEGIQPRRFQEAFDGLVRRTHTGPFAFVAHIRRALGQALDHRCHAAWRREGLDFLEVEPGGFELVAEQARDVVLRPCLHPRRDFF